MSTGSSLKQHGKKYYLYAEDNGKIDFVSNKEGMFKFMPGTFDNCITNFILTDLFFGKLFPLNKLLCTKPVFHLT